MVRSQVQQHRCVQEYSIVFFIKISPRFVLQINWFADQMNTYQMKRYKLIGEVTWTCVHDGLENETYETGFRISWVKMQGVVDWFVN